MYYINHADILFPENSLMSVGIMGIVMEILAN